MNPDHRLLAAVDDVLAQGEELLAAIGADDYGRPSAPVFGATMGGH